MRMSCNGCRVLRKGCSEDCSIRPCLDWIKCPQSQANATLFLAKFYGRAGLINLINSASENHRPAIFRSLLHEACGRIVNPVYGSVGLLWSGSWQLCQAAVEAVLKGEPITPIASEATHGPPFKAYDIRHVAKDDNLDETHRVKTRSQLRRAVKPKPSKKTGSVEDVDRSESSLSQPGKDSESGVSVETSILFHDEPESEAKIYGQAEDGMSNEVGLELRLGFEPVHSREPCEEHVVPIKKRKFNLKDCNASCKVELGLEFAT
ncbi:LOB domain-containing protein 41-like [Trifolium pratense]|uniref:LOB domain-containing protein 41-like n=1 Tax=Trifolium pratense TaxID=57577 RepID=A0A2K3P377_TRIPR|nr:LOB domain-containing protein 40-like [Trifolium pratense]PNY09741.1 LOB domain-containing protein 41-like [Trifolium pratense]